jgi:hypothetical protein
MKNLTLCMKNIKVLFYSTVVLAGLFALGSHASGQNIVWTSGNTVGDASLVTAGTEFDGIEGNTSETGLTVDGINFNSNIGSTTNGTDASGDLSFAWNATTGGTVKNFNFTTISASTGTTAPFASLLDDGGTFQTGNSTSQTGIFTINNLTIGDSYEVEVFSYANDGDLGSTTLGGTTPATLTDGGGISSTSPEGQFGLGTFTASTSTTETFTYTGAGGSGFTVLGPVFVQDVTGVPEPSTYALLIGGLLALGLFRARFRKNTLD